MARLSFIIFEFHEVTDQFVMYETTEIDIFTLSLHYTSVSELCAAVCTLKLYSDDVRMSQYVNIIRQRILAIR